MPSMPLYYTLLNSNGEIILSQITQDPEYPISEGQRLVVDQIPDHDSLTQYIVRVEPVPEGQDYIEYQIKDIVYTDEQLISSATIKRKDLFLQSDWTQLSDVQLTVAQVDAWKVYRQALRDITDQPGYPGTIIWPTIPE
jgi:hypothetical protein